ncbi:mariner Mos1 transposase [Trichonephila clavipes]|nr:mariner Mos1 transposase [Trichonephila clavipes]
MLEKVIENWTSRLDYIQASHGNHMPEIIFKMRFEKFQNGDFDVRNEKRVRPAKKFEDAELQVLLDESEGQTQEHLAEQLNVDQSTVSRRLKAMGKIIKIGIWVSHRLTNPKRNQSYVDPGQPSKSTARPNRFDRKTMLCLFLDQEGPIYYELLKLGGAVNTDCYKQLLFNLNDAILEKREQYEKWQHKVIFLDDNVLSHRAKPTKNIIKVLGWELLVHAAYSSDLAPSDYHLFSSFGHALADQSFTSYENVKSWLDDWLASKAWYLQIARRMGKMCR